MSDFQTRFTQELIKQFVFFVTSVLSFIAALAANDAAKGTIEACVKDPNAISIKWAYAVGFFVFAVMIVVLLSLFADSSNDNLNYRKKLRKAKSMMINK